MKKLLVQITAFTIFILPCIALLLTSMHVLYSLTDNGRCILFVVSLFFLLWEPQEHSLPKVDEFHRDVSLTLDCVEKEQDMHNGECERRLMEWVSRRF